MDPLSVKLITQVASRRLLHRGFESGIEGLLRGTLRWEANFRAFLRMPQLVFNE